MDPYDAIARYYDLEHAAFDDDIAFYREYIQRDPVLEVGVGTGRVALPLLEAGLEVWGIDVSAQMLAVARQRLAGYERIHLLQVSAVELDLPERFPTVLMPLNILWHCGDQEGQIASLSAMRRHMTRDGLLIVDCSNPLTMADRGASGQVRQRFHSVGGELDVRGWSACWDDEAEQTLSLSLYYDEVQHDLTLRRSSVDLELRYTYRAELHLLLRCAGFDLLHDYGSYDLEPFSAGSPNLIAVARAR
ncbi:MAG: class I SAM-dependent methyltransferase [Chloroflexota bacterium]